MNTILALDIGTEYVKAVLARPGKKGNLEILGFAKVRQREGNMYAGAIADIPAVVAVCEEALIKVEDETKERADLTVVGIAGELIKGNTTSVRYTRKNPDKPITELEMNGIIKKVQGKSGDIAKKTIALETNNDNVEVRLINSAIVSITIDGYKISNPVGFKGSEISILVYTAFAPLIHVAAIEKVCAELNLNLLTIAVEPFAVCRACLGDNPDASFSGIVIDIGGGTTDIAIVDDGTALGTKMFNIGGRSFTRQIEESLGVPPDTAEEYKLACDTGSLDDYKKAKIESALSRSFNVWLAGVEVALDDFQLESTLPHNIVLCGGGASLGLLQENLAITDWYKSLPFSRRPIIHLLDIAELPNFTIKSDSLTLDHSYATALGLLRVGVDTLLSAPEEHKLRAKLARLLQN